MALISWPLGGAFEKRVLFYAESPVKVAMFRPIQERLSADGRVGVWFAGQLLGSQSSKVMARKLGITGVKPIHRGLSSLARFDALITADYELWSGYDKPFAPIAKTPRVQIFHGVSVRNGAVQPSMTQFARLFSVGPYMTRRFVEQGIFEADDPRLVPVGMPKTDRFFDGSLDRDATLEALGLDKDRPTIMLAPTWLRRSPLTEYGDALLEALASGPWNLIVKLHDKFLDARYNQIDWIGKLAAFGARDGCAVLLDEYDAVPFLWASDLLISDLSSIANEYALLDRPLVYLRVGADEKLVTQYPRLDLDTWGQRAGEAVDSVEACVRAVEAGLADPGARSSFRKELGRDLFYNHGQASQHAADAMNGLLGLT